MRSTFTLLLLLVVGLCTQADAATFFNNRAAIQGYLKQGTTALNDATGYPMRFLVKRNSTVVWCQTSAANVPVKDGIFNVVLSGNSNCQSLTNALDGSVFAHTANSDLFVFDVIVDISKDGFGGLDDASFAGIDIVSSPLAIYANFANTAASATTATTATSATTATTAATALTAGNVTGTVALANGGTGATTASAARTNLGLGSLATVSTSGNATHYLKGDGTWAVLPGGGGSTVTSVAGRTGAVTLTTSDISGLGTAATMASTAFMQGSNNLSDVADSTAARANLNAAGSGTNTDITSINLSAAGTALTVANDASIGGNAAVTGNATVGGTLGVTGAATLASASVTGNATVGGTLGVTGTITGNLNGAARQASSHVAATTAGTTTAYTLTNSPAISAGPASGTVVIFKVNATNGASPTLNVDGTGAKSLMSAKTGAALAAGDLVANKFVTATYDGTNWVVDIPPLPFSVSGLSCGSNLSAGLGGACTDITAANVNAGDMVQCSPSADPSSTTGRVVWSAMATAGAISIRLACSSSTTCTLTNRNWKCLVFK